VRSDVFHAIREEAAFAAGISFVRSRSLQAEYSEGMTHSSSELVEVPRGDYQASTPISRRSSDSATSAHKAVLQNHSLHIAITIDDTARNRGSENPCIVKNDAVVDC